MGNWRLHQFRTRVHIFHEYRQCRKRCWIVSSSSLQKGHLTSFACSKFSFLSLVMVLCMPWRMNQTNSSTLGGARPLQITNLLRFRSSCIHQALAKDFIENSPLILKCHHATSLVCLERCTSLRLSSIASKLPSSHWNRILFHTRFHCQWRSSQNPMLATLSSFLKGGRKKVSGIWPLKVLNQSKFPSKTQCLLFLPLFCTGFLWSPY